MAAPHDRNRRLGRTEHTHVLISWRRAGERTAIGLRRMPVVCCDDDARQAPEWRVAIAFALLDLVAIEGFAITGNQRAHDRVFGLVRLQKAYAAPLLAAGPPDNLVEQLECALGCAWIAVAEPKVGIDDSDHIELGKMVTFGDKLRADNEIETALGHVVEFLPQPFDGFDHIAGQHQDACLRKEFCRLLFETFDPRTDCSKAIGRMTVRAFRRRRHRKAAVVTDQPPLEAMIDQPGIAIRTLQPESASPAQRERRIAATIEKQKRLLATGQ